MGCLFKRHVAGGDPLLLDLVIAQAAAEAVGLSGVMAQLTAAGQRAMYWAQDHWLAIAGVVIVVLFLTGGFQRKT